MKKLIFFITTLALSAAAFADGVQCAEALSASAKIPHVMAQFAGDAQFIHSARYPDLPGKLPKNFLYLPLQRQANDDYCGPASAYSVLVRYGVFDGREDMIAKWAKTNKDGTTLANLTAVFNRPKFALKAEALENVNLEDILKAIDDGRPVIIDLQAWRTTKQPWPKQWEAGHFVAVSGYDAKSKILYLMDPSTAGNYAYITFQELPGRWHDYDNIDGKKVKYTHPAIFFGRALPPYAPKVPHMD